MLPLSRNGILAVVALASFGPASAAAAPAAGVTPLAATPLEVYGRLPTLEDVALSPDGSKLAFVRTVGDERFLLVKDLSNGKSIYGARVGSTKLRSVQWADDDDLLVTVSSTQLPPIGFIGPRSEWSQLLHCDLTRKKTAGVSLAVLGARTFNIISPPPMLRRIDGRTVLFVRGLTVADRVEPALFRYDLKSGATRIVAVSREPRTEWLVDAAGEVAAEFQYDDASRQWTLLARRDRRLAPAATGSSSLDEPRLVGFDFMGESILVEFLEDQRPVWKLWNLKAAAWKDAPDGEAFDDVVLSAHDGRIVGRRRKAHNQYEFYDSELQAHWDAARREFPADERVDVLSGSGDWARMILQIFGAKDGYGYELFDWYTHRILPLAPAYDGLARVAQVKEITYPAADGLPISAYLTLPAGTRTGAEPHGWPLVVLPHGGPAAADWYHFDWWAQALADRGYVVLQPNYRGSDLGRVHLAAGFGEWGRKMQTDLSDGVRHLAERGLIDPTRVCIVGASYGGYAALAGMTLQPGIYRCAVSVAGLSDLRAMMHWARNNAGRSDNYTQRYWDRYMGVSGPDDPKLKEISPIEHVDAVRGPVLLVHGRDDTVVPYEQSEAMERVMRRAGKSVELVTLKNEDHWLSRSETRLQMLEATVRFLEQYDPP